MGNIRWLLDDDPYRGALFRMPLRSISFIHKANLVLSSHLNSPPLSSPVLLDCNTSEFLDMKWGCSFSPAPRITKFSSYVVREQKRYMTTHLPQSSFPGLKREYLFFSTLTAAHSKSIFHFEKELLSLYYIGFLPKRLGENTHLVLYFSFQKKELWKKV